MHEAIATPAVAAPSKPFGTVAWFPTPAGLLHAVDRLYVDGYRKMDCHTPFPVHGLDKAMRLRDSDLAWVILAAGTSGLVFAIGLAYWTQWIDYPLIIGGKNGWSWPAYVPIFFELTVLFSALTAFGGLWAFLGLPRPHHPVFHHTQFHRATDDGFFVAVEAADPKYDAARLKTLLESLGAQDVEEVPS